MRIRILVGDVLARLRELPSNHYDCVITSPPYWGLRDYGVLGQIGLEPTLGEHLEVMVAVCAEIWRVLKPTGTFWLNYGDCYATAPNGRSAEDTKALGNDDRTFRDKPFSTVGPIHEPQPASRQKARRGKPGGLGNGGLNGKDLPSGRVVSGGVLKPKDLCMIPNRLAIALQEAGWWVRSENVWGKLNPMPESIDDRPATAHEKVFMLTKSGKPTIWRARDTREWSLTPDHTERLAAPTEDEPDKTVNRWRAFDYYYDADAVRFELQPKTFTTYGTDRNDFGDDGSGMVKKANMAKRMPRRGPRKQDAIAESAASAGGSSGNRMAGFNDRWIEQGGSRRDSFARAGKLATSEHGQKPQFRDDREPVAYSSGRNLRNYEPAPLEVWRIATKPFSEAHFATFPPALAERCIMAGCPPGGLVLDPFGGAGTTGLVAEHLQRDCDMIELNGEYARLAVKRLRRDFGLFGTVEIIE